MDSGRLCCVKGFYFLVTLWSVVSHVMDYGVTAK